MIGKHIRARRGGRWSHAIDCGDETVIELEHDGGAPRVLRSYRPGFVAGAELVEVVPHRERALPPEEVVARAQSVMGDPAAAARFPDSAAFAEWCATGSIGEPERTRDRAAARPQPKKRARTGTGTGTRKSPARAPRGKGGPRGTAGPAGRGR